MSTMRTVAVRRTLSPSLLKNATNLHNFKSLKTTPLASAYSVTGRSSLGLLDSIGAASRRKFASTASRLLATPTSTPLSGSQQQPSPGPTSLNSSLSRLLPPGQDQALPTGLPRDEAERVVQLTLESLLESTSVSSLEEGKLVEDKLRTELERVLSPHSLPLSTLHTLSLHILRASSDPRKQPIAHRLFHISSGIDPYEFASSWSSSSPKSDEVFKSLGLDGSPKGKNGPVEALVRNRGLSKSSPTEFHAASLSLFSSLILAASAPPPPGTSSLPDKGLQQQMRLAQRSAALRIYARLAEEGQDGGALFGWGMARLQALERSKIGADGMMKIDEITQMESQGDLKEILNLWQKSAEKGVKEGWFELGRLHLTGTHIPKNEKAAMEFFEKGAQVGNVRAHHALGILHSQADGPSISAEEKAEKLQKSYHHFLSAAEMGDTQSAHNVGVRHLLTEVPFPQEDSQGAGSVNGEQVGMSQEEKNMEAALMDAIAMHEQRWGVKPDDDIAKRWFGVASRGGFVPSMLNLASLLISGRGSTYILPSSAIDPMPSSTQSSEAPLSPRLEELKQAETLYMRIIGMSGLGGGTADPASKGAPKSPNEEMAEFAQEALEGVKEMIKEELKKY